MEYKKLSVFMAGVLRHHPERAGITLDKHGWAKVPALIEGMKKHKYKEFSMEILEEIVRTDEKGRYSFNEDKTLIRANQGHSIDVDVELEKAAPPAVLYHGTGLKYTESIEAQGLIPKSRLYVHLSLDWETARIVGARHGSPVIYEIDTPAMVRDGFIFFRSVNGVWLTKEVPVRYLKRLPENG